MRRIDIDDMDAVMSFKGKGNSRRYAFDDYSDRIKLSNKIAKILKDRRKRSNNKPKKEHMGKPMAGAEALLKMKATMRSPQLVMVYKDTMNVRCNMTHIFLPKAESKEHPGFILVGTKLYSVDRGIEFGEWINLKGIVTLSQAKRECPNLHSIHWSRSSDGEIGNMYSAVGNVH